jgi:hypothetical protein
MAMIFRRTGNRSSGRSSDLGNRNLFTTEGGKQIDQMLARIPKSFNKQALEIASKPSAEIIRDEAKNIIGKRIKNKDQQSKAAYVQRSIRALVSKSKYNYGYNVYVKGKDITVGNRMWGVVPYAILLGEGAYHQKDRSTRKTKANRGSFDGFGNFIVEAGQRKGTIARQKFLKNIYKISQALLKNG